MEMTLVCPAPLWQVELIIGGLWFFPIGALVMRRHLTEATGPHLVAKGLLFTMAWVTGPLAVALTVFTVLPAAIEVAQTIAELARVAW